MHISRPRPTWCALRSRRRTALAILVALTAAVAGVGVSVEPASAHNQPNPERQQLLYHEAVGSYGGPGQCIFVQANQNHGSPPSHGENGSYTSTFVQTRSTGGQDCAWQPHNQFPGHIQHRGTVYKSGVVCAVGGWDWNREYHWILNWFGDENYGLTCSGRGFNGVASHDTHHRVWNPYAGRWNGPRSATPFPTTYHRYPYNQCC